MLYVFVNVLFMFDGQVNIVDYVVKHVKNHFLKSLFFHIKFLYLIRNIFVRKR